MGAKFEFLQKPMTQCLKFKKMLTGVLKTSPAYGEDLTRFCDSILKPLTSLILAHTFESNGLVRGGLPRPNSC